jgi:uncharacterized lipoprotein YmbA
MKLSTMLSLATMLAACHSSPPVRFFTLDPVPSSRQTTNMSDVSVQVGAVHVPLVLDRQQMVREEAPNSLTISNQNRWGAPLADMVRDVLTRDLIERLPKGTVVLPETAAPLGTGVIAVDILHFGSDPSGTASFDGSWSLSRDDSNAPVSVRHVALSERTEQNDYAGDARAMSRLVGRLADEMAGVLVIGAEKHNAPR